MANKRLSTSIVIGGQITGSLRSAMGVATKSITRLGEETRKLQREQKFLAGSIQTFGQMGKNVDGLRERYAKVTAELNRMAATTQRLQRIESAREANLAKRANLRGQMMDAVALGMTVAAPVMSAVNFESSMADVKKVVDFDTADQFKAMSNEIIRMSTVLPMAAADIAEIVAAGGQSGLARDELTGFAESAVKMGVAFNMTAGEAGQMMAEMRAAFKMSQPEMNTLADKMNLLANTTAASENKIAAIVGRVGPLGEVAGLAAGEIAALGATLAGIGVEENIAATGIQNFMLAMVAGEAATKSQRAGFKKLGLDSTKLAKGMQKDAQGTIMTVLNAVKKLPDYQQASILQQIFGKESIKAIAPLLTVTESLAENLNKVNDETLYAGAVNKEYAARAATSANNIQLFKNRISGLSITIGNALLPALNESMAVMGPIVSTVSEFAQANPMLTNSLVMVAGGLIATKVATIGLGYAWTFVKGGALTLASGAVRVASAIRMVGTAAMVAGRMMLLSPIGLVAAGIVTAGILIYREWDRVKSFFGGLWDGLKAGMAPVVAIFDGWTTSMPILTTIWEAVGSAISTVAEWFGKLMEPVKASDEQLKAAGEAGRSMGELIANGINLALTPMRLLIEGIQWLSNNAGAVISSVKGFAESAGQTVSGAWQSTKDFFGISDNPEQQAAVPGQTADQLARMAGVPSLPEPARAGSSTTYTDNSTTTMTVTQLPGEDATALTNRIMKELDKKQQQRARGALTDGAMAQ